MNLASSTNSIDLTTYEVEKVRSGVKIGVLADTHISETTEDIPEEIKKSFKGMDLIIHAGDLKELNVLDRLQTLCSQVIAVCGNMDSPVVRKKLPQRKLVKIGSYKIGVIHGWGPPDKLIDYVTDNFKNDAVDIIIFGHSHSAYNQKRGNILYFNPGSPTDKIFAPYNSYGIIEINDKIETKIIRM